MPYFRKKEFINDSLNSVFNQSYKDFEIIIIYDDDNLEDYYHLKDFQKKNNKIKIIKNHLNRGVAYSRNVGIKESSGDLIAFLDCDDIWKENKLETQINFMREKNVDISFTGYEIIDSLNNIIGKRPAKAIIDFNDLIKSCDIGLSTVIIKKSLLNENIKFGSLKTKEDYVLWLNLAKKNYKFYGINLFLTKWRKLDNSLSSSTLQKLFDGFRVYNKYLKYNKFLSIFCLIRLSLNYLLKK
tara:strand:- start:10217 stop:10939 length:723 start_codon:yes stop_codon:yes gene_type:complete